MSDLESFAATAHLIADPARAMMLTALLDGRALPAGELAYAGGITPQTASSHLAKLLEGGLLSLEIEGRHRYYRLAGPHVAQALEYLAAIRPEAPLRRKGLTPRGGRCDFTAVATTTLQARSASRLRTSWSSAATSAPKRTNNSA